MMRGTPSANQEPMSAPPTQSRSQHNLPDAIPESQRLKARQHDFDKRLESDDDTFPIQGTSQSLDPLTPEQSAEQMPFALQPSSTKSSATEIGVTFDELVDRLLAQPMSKTDTKFQAIFLALYRKFAAPAQLLEAIVTRFEEVGEDDVPGMTRARVHLRHLGILEQWISNYPGDFAYPTTRKSMEKFITRVRPVRLHTLAARELQANLDNAIEDDDTDWAFCDRALQRARLAGDGLSEHVVGLAISDERSPPQSPISGRSASASTSTSSSQTMLNIVESASRQARALMPSPRGRGIPLTKIQWRAFMEASDENIARELTRQDWILFTAIRPRDLIRHVSLSSSEKQKLRGKGLSNVQRMIDHFNHVSYTVINLVLLRDKPKHRALMLEKIMRVARELRKLNNYNGLGAVLAGLNASPVHRLGATRELVPRDAVKDYMKLEILMGSAKSHFAYRLAWENTPGERIPYLPLHRRDLVSAAEGNRTFVGVDSDGEMEARWLEGAAEGSGAGRERWGEVRINWRKFEILGEGVWGVQRAQGVPYGRFGVCEEVRGLVVEAEIVRDDDVSFLFIPFRVLSFVVLCIRWDSVLEAVRLRGLLWMTWAFSRHRRKFLQKFVGDRDRCQISRSAASQQDFLGRFRSSNGRCGLITNLSALSTGSLRPLHPSGARWHRRQQRRNQKEIPVVPGLRSGHRHEFESGLTELIRLIVDFGAILSAVNP